MTMFNSNTMLNMFNKRRCLTNCSWTDRPFYIFDLCSCFDCIASAEKFIDESFVTGFFMRSVKMCYRPLIMRCVY